ncbi:hypothetical protein QA584_17235 [Anaerocolumna sp. AGMB13025]|uniref:hypothetical protein n=1 Tax=Anaerocolumna sp. AGMB13025 TaxID=3039116 RepID=UPI00241DACC8|nr:hypothetical protein [Anaerocolumna sp. AGMB13025]WFR55344.1 hypothetical protein QA584_17235 [Anaerocolumna sp. AGMB13025]
MAKGIYFGVGGAARKVSKLYYGVGGVARKVKKGYIGVNGVARLFFNSAPEKVASVTPLSVASAGTSVAFTGAYAVVANGSDNNGYPTKSVDAYNASLVKVAAPAYDTKYRSGITPASIGGYACFYGGVWTDTSSNYASMIRYDPSLIRTIAATSLAKGGMAVARNTTYTVFIGGSTYNGVTQRTADTVAENFLTQTLPDVSANDIWQRDTMVASTPNYAVFSKDPFNVAYDNARVQVAFSSPGNKQGIGATLKNYILLAGGIMSNAITNQVAAYDYNLTRIATTTLNIPLRYSSSVSRDDYAIIAGGQYGSGQIDLTGEACYFDTFLVRDTLPSLITNMYGAGTFSIGDYAVFAGGRHPTLGVTANVEAYKF